MEKINIVEQTPNVENSIVKTKPGVPRTYNFLQGTLANSWNGGYIKPIAYKKIMAGERISNYRIKGILRTLTPKAPPAQALKTVFKIFFVPNQRVWDNYEKYQAHKGGSSVTKIDKVPTTTGQTLSQCFTSTSGGSVKFFPITDSTYWRDSWVSGYIPRIYSGESYTGSAISQGAYPIPEFNWLPIRGFKAIFNDYLSHKVLQEPMTEYKDDTVSDEEYYSVMPDIGDFQGDYLDRFINKVPKGRKQDSYYTNWRTELEGEDNTIVPMYTDLAKHTEWQKLIAESRAQAENEQLNDWEIIAKIRGSRPITTGKVQFLGMRTVYMNYSQVPQTTYNTSESLNEEFQSLGQTGAFSYTEFDIDLINYHQFIEDGYIHVIAQTSADVVFEGGLDRTLMNVNFDDEYRPDLMTLKDDVIYEKEYFVSTRDTTNNVVGYKRKWSELFKLPNSINGDVTTNPIYGQYEASVAGNPVYTKDYYSFFENPQLVNYDRLNMLVLDNTDIMINKNQVIENEIRQLQEVKQGIPRRKIDYVTGPNQVFMVASAECITDMPVDNSIKDNYTVWSEV